MRAVAVIPAFQAMRTVGDVVRGMLAGWPSEAGPPNVLVVDDGSSDATAEVAREAGAAVVRHAANVGKGGALRTGLERGRELGADVALTLDADLQHPPEEAIRVLLYPAPPHALVLGVRDLLRDGAPKANRISNAISNIFISGFSGRRLADTQCGLRRYPVEQTLSLGMREQGYGFEAEVILRAARAGWPIAELPVRVVYPPDRVSHFRVVRDPTRIVFRVLHTFATAKAEP
jgi:glycosyltransferase involved in cell wall biosynthesis